VSKRTRPKIVPPAWAWLNDHDDLVAIAAAEVDAMFPDTPQIAAPPGAFRFLGLLMKPWPEPPPPTNETVTEGWRIIRGLPPRPEPRPVRTVRD